MQRFVSAFFHAQQYHSAIRVCKRGVSLPKAIRQAARGELRFQSLRLLSVYYALQIHILFSLKGLFF